MTRAFRITSFGAVAILACGAVAYAQEGPVRVWGGEHGDYSRVALRVAPSVDWSYGVDGRRITLRLDGYETAFETDQVNRRRRAHRVPRVSGRLLEGGSELTLDMNCDCGAKVYRLPSDPGVLVVDVSPDPSYPRRPPGGPPPDPKSEAEQKPADRAEIAQDNHTEDPLQTGDVATPTDARAADAPPDPEELQSILLQQLLAATEQGVLKLTDDAAQDLAEHLEARDAAEDAESAEEAADEGAEVETEVDAGPLQIQRTDPDLELAAAPINPNLPTLERIEDPSVRVEVPAQPATPTLDRRPQDTGEPASPIDEDVAEVDGAELAQDEAILDTEYDPRWACQNPTRLRRLLTKNPNETYETVLHRRGDLVGEDLEINHAVIEDLAGGHIRLGLFAEARVQLGVLGPRDDLDAATAAIIDMASLLEGRAPPEESPLLQARECNGVQALVQAVDAADRGAWDRAMELAQPEHTLLLTLADPVRRSMAERFASAALESGDMRRVEQYVAILQNDADAPAEAVDFIEGRRRLATGDRAFGLAALWKVARGTGERPTHAALILSEELAEPTPAQAEELELLLDGHSFVYRDTDLGVRALEAAARLRARDGRLMEALDLLRREAARSEAKHAEIEEAALRLVATVAGDERVDLNTTEIDHMLSAVAALEGETPAAAPRLALAELLVDAGVPQLALDIVEPLGAAGGAKADRVRGAALARLADDARHVHAGEDRSSPETDAQHAALAPAAEPQEAPGAKEPGAEEPIAEAVAEALAEPAVEPLAEPQLAEEPAEDFPAQIVRAERLFQSHDWQGALAALTAIPEAALTPQAARWKRLSAMALGLETPGLDVSAAQDALVTGDVAAAPASPRTEARRLLEATATDAEIAREVLTDG